MGGERECLYVIKDVYPRREWYTPFARTPQIKAAAAAAAGLEHWTVRSGTHPLPPEFEDEPSGPPSAPCVSPELPVIVAVVVAGPSPV